MGCGCRNALGGATQAAVRNGKIVAGESRVGVQ